MKDAAEDVAEDLTQEVAENVLGVAEDGGVKVLIAACHGTRHLPAAEPTPNTRMPPPMLPLGNT